MIAKSAEADFATQRDVSRRKRDIKTIRLKLLIDNPGERYVPGMTAGRLHPEIQAGEAMTPRHERRPEDAPRAPPPLRSRTSSSAMALSKR